MKEVRNGSRFTQVAIGGLRIGVGVGLMWIFAGLLASRASAEEALSCSGALALRGSKLGVEVLRAMLERGALGGQADPVCRRAAVEVRSLQQGWRVALQLDGQRVQREVHELPDATMWVETWLLPLLESPTKVPEASGAESPGAPPGNADPPTVPTRQSDTAPQPDHAADRRRRGAPRETAERKSLRGPDASKRIESPAGQVAALGTLALDHEGSIWGGAHASGRLLLRPRGLWFGAAFARWWAPIGGSAAQQGAAPKWDIYELSIQAGWRFALAEGIALDAGIGGGLAQGESRNQEGLSDGEGAVVAEGLGIVSFEPRPRWVLLGGISAGALLMKGNDGTGGDADPEPVLPALPVGRATFLFGVGYRIGGPERTTR